MVSRDRLVVGTLRCGRSNPGSNPGPGMSFLYSFCLYCAKELKKLNVVPRSTMNTNGETEN